MWTIWRKQSRKMLKHNISIERKNSIGLGMSFYLSLTFQYPIQF